MPSTSTTLIAKNFLARLAVIEAAKTNDPVRLTSVPKPSSLKLTASGPGPETMLQFTLLTAGVPASFDVVVSRTALKEAIAKAGLTVALEPRESTLAVSSNGTPIAELAVLPDAESPAPALMPKDAETATLPTNFTVMLSQAMSCASTDKSRPALNGVNLSAEGIAATDGRQLFHLRLPLRLTRPVTLPRSPVLSKLASSSRWAGLSHWTNGSGKPVFRVMGEDFIWQDAAIDAPYPQVKAVIPDAKLLDTEVRFPPFTAKAICDFAKELKKATQCAVTFSRNFVRFESMDNPAMAMTARAECNAERKVYLDLVFLVQLLQLGHDGIRFSRTSRLPLAGIGGQGTYVFMPLGTPESASATQQPVSQPSQSTQPVTSQPKPQPETKETHMNTAIATAPAPTTAVSRPATSSPFITAPMPQQDPLERLTALLAEMKNGIAALEGQMAEAQRKLREVTVSQRAKERAYQDATRKLDRIRLAV